MTRVHRRVVALLLALTALVPGAVRAQTPTLADEYRQIVETYRSGATDTAVERLLALDQPALAALVGRYVKLGALGAGLDPARPPRFHQAASLLHAQAAVSKWRSGDSRAASTHMGLARGLIDTVPSAGDAAAVFRRRWYLATSLMLTRVLPPTDAAAVFADAIRRVPRDVRLMVAAGWLHEYLSDGTADPTSNLRTVQTLRARQLETAARHYSNALLVDPDAPEAVLRLARVQIAMGRDERAFDPLTTLLARDDIDTTTAYVGRLLLGGIHERRGRRADAERRYREAIDLDLVAQSARLALGQLLYAAGDAEGAADLVEPLLDEDAPRERNDPWADYRLGYPQVGRLLFEELVAEVHP